MPLNSLPDFSEIPFCVEPVESNLINVKSKADARVSAYISSFISILTETSMNIMLDMWHGKTPTVAHGQPMQAMHSCFDYNSGFGADCKRTMKRAMLIIDHNASLKIFREDPAPRRHVWTHARTTCGAGGVESLHYDAWWMDTHASMLKQSKKASGQPGALFHLGTVAYSGMWHAYTVCHWAEI